MSIGIDEVGRGCLAGPVVVCACYIPEGFNIPGVKDSKLIVSEKKREQLFNQIVEYPGVEYSISVGDVKEIDQDNILATTLRHMKICGEDLKTNHPDTQIFVDGNHAPRGLECVCVIKGDQKITSISCASIIAKVSRDRIMNRYEEIYPGFDFSRNKGYGTRSHISTIKSGRYTDIHRRTFNPLRDMLNS